MASPSLNSSRDVNEFPSRSTSPSDWTRIDFDSTGSTDLEFTFRLEEASMNDVETEAKRQTADELDKDQDETDDPFELELDMKRSEARDWPAIDHDEGAVSGCHTGLEMDPSSAGANFSEPELVFLHTEKISSKGESRTSEFHPEPDKSRIFDPSEQGVARVQPLSTPKRTSSTLSLRELETPFLLDTLSLPSPPPASHCIPSNSLASRRHMPSLDVPTDMVRTSLHSTGSPLSPSFSVINPSPYDYYRLPLSPSYSVTSKIFPLPPMSSANPSTISFPPSTPTQSWTLDPSTPSPRTFHFPSTSLPDSDKSELRTVVPKFVSVFVPPDQANNAPRRQSGTPSDTSLASDRCSAVEPSDFHKQAIRHYRADSILRHRGSVFGDEADLQNLQAVNRRTMDWVQKTRKTSVRESHTHTSKPIPPDKVPRKKRIRFRENRLKRFFASKRRRFILATTLFLVVMVVAIAAALSKRKTSSPGECTRDGGTAKSNHGQCLCAPGLGSTRCHLNTTCIEIGGQKVVQGFLDLARTESAWWEPTIDPARLAYTLNHYVQPLSSLPACQAQLSLIDFPSLATLPDRLTFAQIALAHTLALSESNLTTFRLHKFISSLDFAHLDDAPASRPDSNYQIISAGYTWDFATMQRTVQTMRWQDLAKPSTEEIVRMEGKTQALDRITPFAIASSSQRTEALQHYWIDTLGLEEPRLERFRSAIQNSEILVPMCAEAKQIQSYNVSINDATDMIASFGCRGKLTEEMRMEVEASESQVFGLSASDPSSALDNNTRPVYGILNILPNTEFSWDLISRPARPQASIVLQDLAYNRISLHAGEFLPVEPDSPVPLSAPTTLEHFGLYNRLDHVLLEYLQLFNIKTASLLIQGVLAPEGASRSSKLVQEFDGAQSLPVIGVQVWGGIRWSDIAEPHPQPQLESQLLHDGKEHIIQRSKSQSQTPYHIFQRKRYAELKESMPKADVKQRRKIISEEWKSSEENPKNQESES
ncbi:HMG-box domain-containing protein [Sporobolomyces koalae]|uniref:HMG-box domain-containing protein n=1 Tax=Sporobolomyces koalae TaxID=500713 RepID=UPI00316B3B75